jgi:molecular chaperone GrpE
MSTEKNSEPTANTHDALAATEVEAAGVGEAGPSDAEAEPRAEESAAQAPPPPDFRELRIQTLERALAEREATLHSYIRAHKKAEADFEAYKQRLERDRERELAAARAKLVERLLDVDDNLERTLAAARSGGAGAIEGLVKGVELIHRQFIERLTELGLERTDPTGKPFDPNSMEALGVVPVDDPAKNDTVVVTMRSGYRLGDREIRPALVQVGRFMS